MFHHFFWKWRVEHPFLVPLKYRIPFPLHERWLSSIQSISFKRLFLLFGTHSSPSISVPFRSSLALLCNSFPTPWQPFLIKSLYNWAHDVIKAQFQLHWSKIIKSLNPWAWTFCWIWLPLLRALFSFSSYNSTLINYKWMYFLI